VTVAASYDRLLLGSRAGHSGPVSGAYCRASLLRSPWGCSRPDTRPTCGRNVHPRRDARALGVSGWNTGTGCAGRRHHAVGDSRF